eukprot:CAMPEP_0201667290 /NCGR_PEP_ID=MMETSP0494-20130426/13531_1 /ASSEMBLY_ACC=CAM_ASM_000839 /TAXON_ID=420259 /ORGANISM="Thalassiosira gravida, Strain GMp14c1" /LENGTH=346 /DNA_ID=CAMNT_0048147173 /DNA_START=187 /DNA_END=1223 /DNA_ORIENTATION=-
MTKNTKRQVGILSVVGLVCIIGYVFNVRSINSFVNTLENTFGGRRYLASLDPYLDSSLLPAWAQYNLVDVTEYPDPTRETALFWHVPKSGGTTAKRVYECLGQTLANRLGADPRFGHDQDEEIVIFHPFATEPEIKFVNVDTTTKAGVVRAARLGLVPSGKVDMIFSTDVNFATEHLFDPDHKGRILALFRNPVDRSVSKFYYLQTATWERTYRPEWKDMGIVEWATNHNLDENFIVKKIVGKKLNDPVDIADLIVAKDIIRRHFVVGLMTNMEESISRFNVFLGLNLADVNGKACKEQYLGVKKEKKVEVTADADAGNAEGMNSHSHPKHEPGSLEYNVIAERNA